LRVVEHHMAADAHAHLGNVVADYRLADEARLDLMQLQDAAEGAALIRRSDARLGRAARLRMHTVELGAQFMRHQLDIALAGRGARFESRGVFALHGRQHADTRMQVTHDARDTECDIGWRGVADQRSRGVFHGAITVAAGADGADARLSNKNLLLSAQAEIDTQPVLEIHADEVKAAHGATVGQLDPNALFYLRSRGIPEADARRLLTAAFCREIVAGVDDAALRTALDAALARALSRIGA
jgi:Fe-S cluster assembly protein SufD